MITRINDLLDSGLNISDEIADARLLRVLKDTEMGIVKPRLGDDTYIEIMNDPTAYYEYVNGGAVTYAKRDKCGHEEEITVLLSGLKEAICHIAFGMLIRDNAMATTYGSVVKREEFSGNDPEENRGTAMMHYELGIHYLNEVCEALGIESNGSRYGISYGEWLG